MALTNTNRFKTNSRAPHSHHALALASSAISLHSIPTSQIITSAPIPAIQACQDLQARRRLHPQAPISKAAAQMIQICSTYMLHKEARLDLVTPSMLHLLHFNRKTSTLNSHALQFQKWLHFTRAKSLPVLPASPLAVAAFLHESALHDRTASPTINRCGAVAYFSHIAGTPNPMVHPLCQPIKEALLRKLGLLGTKKMPLLHCQVMRILQTHLEQPISLDSLMTCFHIALMYEGCLRWHDLAQLLFGDIIITPTFLRLFIQSAKTDTYRQGQWITIASSADNKSACQLLHNVLYRLASLWSQATIPKRQSMLHTGQGVLIKGSMPQTQCPFTLPLRDIPVVFAINTETALPQFDRSTTYPKFLARLKAWGAAEGIRPQDIGTHSLRRGLASDWTLQGIPDRLRREHGRWKSEKAADGYIDASINIYLLLHSLQKIT